MQCIEFDRLDKLIAASLEGYHSRPRTPAEKQEECMLRKRSLLAPAKLRQHHAAGHPELGTKSTIEDLVAVYGDDDP
jgi:hypothetical protein